MNFRAEWADIGLPAAVIKIGLCPSRKASQSICGVGIVVKISPFGIKIDNRDILNVTCKGYDGKEGDKKRER